MDPWTREIMARSKPRRHASSGIRSISCETEVIPWSRPSASCTLAKAAMRWASLASRSRPWMSLSSRRRSTVSALPHARGASCRSSQRAWVTCFDAAVKAASADGKSTIGSSGTHRSLTRSSTARTSRTVALGIGGPCPSHGCSPSQVHAVSELGVLATRRRAPRMPGGMLCAVPPLPAPTPEAVLGAGTAVKYPALAPLAERAPPVVREFAIITENQLGGSCRPELLLDVRAQDVLLDLAGSCHGQG